MEKCAESTVEIMLNLEKERVFDFLVGLNRDLDDVHGRLAARDPFPSPDDAFLEVRRDELQSKVMLTDVVPQSLSAPESSVMVSHKTLLKVSAKTNGLGVTTVITPAIHWTNVGKFTANPQTGSPEKNLMVVVCTATAQEQPTSSNISVPCTKEQIDQIEEYRRSFVRHHLIHPQVLLLAHAPLFSLSLLQALVILSGAMISHSNQFSMFLP